MNLIVRETFVQEIFVGKGLVYSLVWRMGGDEYPPDSGGMGRI